MDRFQTLLSVSTCAASPRMRERISSLTESAYLVVKPLTDK
jgi:hypothetical protein